MLLGFLSHQKRIVFIAFSCYVALLVYGIYTIPIIGEIGPGGAKRTVAIYEVFYTRDDMTYAMSAIPLSPQNSGLFLSFIGGLLICISSALLSQNRQICGGVLIITSVYPKIIWISLLHGPDALALGMMWCGILLSRQHSWIPKLFSLWFLIWAYHLKMTVWPLFFACVPLFTCTDKGKSLRYIITCMALYGGYIFNITPIWYALIFLSSPLFFPKIRSDWILAIFCLGYTIDHLGDKIRPRYLIPLETYFVYLIGIQVSRYPKRLYIIAFVLILMSIDRINAWCHIFSKYDTISCPVEPKWTTLSTLTHSDHSFVGHTQLKKQLQIRDPRGWLISPLRDAREFHIRSWGYETQTEVVLISQSTCCRPNEELTQCTGRLVNNISQFGGTMIIPSKQELQRRIPPQHLDFLISLQKELQKRNIYTDQYWLMYTKNKNSKLPLPCSQ
jgi:hypothetical protein